MQSSNIASLLAIVALVVGIGGLLFAVYSHYQSEKIRRLSWGISSRLIISGENVRVISSYKGSFVGSVSETIIPIQNTGGSAIIYSADELPNDPLRVVLPRYVSLYSTEVSAASSPSVGATLQAIDLEAVSPFVMVRFEKLLPSGGFVITLVHSGFSADDFRLEGGFRGVNQEKIKNPRSVANDIERRSEQLSSYKSAANVRAMHFVFWGFIAISTIIVGRFFLTFFQ